MAKSSTVTMIDTVGEWYAKLPNLPKNIQEVLVKIAPWAALIFGILGVLAGIVGLGVLTVFAPFAMLGGAQGVKVAGAGIWAAVMLLLSSGLMLAAFPSLRKGKAAGWNLLFWSETVTIVSSVLAFSLSGILFDLIGFYILFQIRTYFK